MGFWPSKRNSRPSTSLGGGGGSDQQSWVEPAGFRFPRLWRISKSANSSTPQLLSENPPHSNNLQISALPFSKAATVATNTGLSPVVVNRTQDIDHSTSVQNTDSTLPTVKQKENGNKKTLKSLVTNSPTEPLQQDPPSEPAIQSSGIQLPAINVETPTSQSRLVEELSTEEQVSPVCHASLQDGKSVWERTLDIAETMLRDHGLPPLDGNTLSSTSSAENIQAVLDTLQSAQGEDQKVKLIGRDRLRRILRGVEKYTIIVDTAVQHGPEVTALVWAGIRGILQVSIQLLQVEIYINSGLMIYAGRFP